MSQLTPSQVEQIQEIGAKLRQLRQEQSMQLEEVKVKTYIPLRVLQALENGQVDQLPEPVFIQGFIRRYGDLLGLDGQALAQGLTLQSELVPPALVPLEASARQSNLAASLRSYLPVAALVAASLAAIALAPQLGKLLAARRPATPSSPVASPSVPPTPVSPPVASPKPSPQPAGVEVAVNLTDDSWMQVVIDGKQEFEGVLPKGSTRTWKAKQTLVVQAGNAGAVAISFNQQQSQLMGALGEVREMTFTPQGVQNPL